MSEILAFLRECWDELRQGPWWERLLLATIIVGAAALLAVVLVAGLLEWVSRP